VYVAGSTTSFNFPANGLQTVYGGGTGLLNGGPGGDVFVAKLNAAGNALVYATFLGDSGDEAASGLAVDSAGSVYITGSTTSTNFPTTAGAFQTTRKTTSSQGFVAKLNPTGTALVYSTYLGGSSGEQGGGIAVDATGHAYVTGITGSSDFPTLNSLQPFRGTGDAFITKLAPDGSGLVYSTLLGGSSNEWGKAITVDAAGNAYVAGYTNSTDFPTANAAQGSSAGGNGALASAEAFVTKLNPGGTAFVYSTYLGGSGDDQAAAIAVDAAGNAYVTGTTVSTNFPTVSAYQPAPMPGSTSNIFVTKLTAAGAIAYSTFLGGSGGGSGSGRRADHRRGARDPRRHVRGLRGWPPGRPHAPRVRAAPPALRGGRPRDTTRGHLRTGLGLFDGSRRPLGRRLREKAATQAGGRVANLALPAHPFRSWLSLRGSDRRRR